jgi:hypothetical protein
MSEHNYNVRNAEYTSEDLTLIDVVLDHPQFGEIPYTYDTNTPNESLDDIVEAALVDLDIAPYVEKVLTPEAILAAEIHGNLLYLRDTDWVIVKIQEAALLNEDTTALQEKYSDILTQRQEARAAINELEAQ